jgi:hypothetical protein
MAEKNVQVGSERQQDGRRTWVTPVVIVGSPECETNLVANTISDATANLQS